MAKTKEQKYNGAVERNIHNLEVHGCIPGDDLWSIKKAAGIRNGDTRFDNRIHAILRKKHFYGEVH